MHKLLKLISVTALLSISITTTAFAGTWKQNDQGQWWQEDDHTYPKSAWEWIDSNDDGMAECYYFDENGYLLTGTTTPDGYAVDESGAWMDQGVIRQKASSPFAANKMNEEGLRLYQDADQKSSQLKGMDIKAKAQFNLNYNGENLPFTTDILMKYHDLSNPNMEFLISIAVDMMDEDLSKATIFYTNGCYYMDGGKNSKYKYKVDYSEIADQLKDVNFAYHLSNYLDNMQVANDQNGNKVLFYSTNQKDLDSYIKTLYDEIMPYLSYFDIQINQLNGKAVISPEGYFLKEVITANVALSYEGETIEMETKFDIDYNNPGQPVTIQFPSTEGYEEFVY